MKPWQLGNTTVRSALRLRDALIALDAAGAEGSIRGRDGDLVFRDVLGSAGVVDLGEDVTASVGRKFRSAMAQLGFLYPKAPDGIEQLAIGRLDCITPAGRRLIDASSLFGQQECFLRGLVGRSLDLSPGRYQSPGSFSPLLRTLQVMSELDRRCGDSRISFTEFSIFVQVTGHESDVNGIVEKILSHRRLRDGTNRKKQFDEEAVTRQRLDDGSVVQNSTYRDYADMNFRYLRATGLFRQRGRGLGFFEDRQSLIDQLLSSITPISEPLAYWQNLTNGPSLPFDDFDDAKRNISELLATAESRRIPLTVNISTIDSVADAELARHEIEEQIAEFDEIEFARAQARQWEQISRYLSVLEEGRVRIPDEYEESVVIPRGEAAAYLEWAVWRAFLAINRLVNPPSRSRRFPIDRDFLPINNAPSGGPDLIFEFEDFVLVVEVTLLKSGRQEAAEGYPVRQHVFQTRRDYAQLSNKPVYGLFIAPSLDPNSVSTFQRGQWLEGDHESRLDIVPLTISQFNQFFAELFANDVADNSHVQRLVAQCLTTRDTGRRPSEWQDSIAASLRQVLSYACGDGRDEE